MSDPPPVVSSSSPTTGYTPLAENNTNTTNSCCGDFIELCRFKTRTVLFGPIGELWTNLVNECCSSSSSSSSSSEDEQNQQLQNQQENSQVELRSIAVLNQNNNSNNNNNQDDELSLLQNQAEQDNDHEEDSKNQQQQQQQQLQQVHYASPFSIIDFFLIFATVLNCAILGLNQPKTPPGAVQRYVDWAAENLPNASETELLVHAPTHRLVDFTRPYYATAIEYGCISFFLLEVVLRTFAFGIRWQLLSRLRTVDALFSIGSFAAVVAEATGALPSPSRWLGLSALKLVVIPSVLVRSNAVPRGTEMMYEQLLGAIRRSAPVFSFFFFFVAAMALFFLGLLNGEMKSRCVLNEWMNVSHCFGYQNQNNLENQNQNFEGNSSAAVSTFASSSSSCSIENNTEYRFIRSFNLSTVFLSDVRNFVCSGVFDSTVLGKPSTLACSTQQVCVARSFVGSESTGWRCPYGYTCQRVENLFSGKVGFDNYLQSLFTTFVASSEKLWFILGPSAADSSMDAFFFVFVLFICLSVLILNVTVVTLCMEYEKALAAIEQGLELREEEEKRKQEQLSSQQENQHNQIEDNQQQQPQQNEIQRGDVNNNNHNDENNSEVEASLTAGVAPLPDSNNQNENRNQNNFDNRKNSAASSSSSSSSSFFDRDLNTLIKEDVGFAFFSCITATLHIALLMAYTSKSSKKHLHLINTADTIFIFVLGAETLVRLLAAGPRRYFSSSASGLGDLLVLLFAAVGIPLDMPQMRCTRILRAARVFDTYYTRVQTYLINRFGITPWRIPTRWYRALKKSVASSLLLLIIIVTGVIVAGICMQHAGGGWLCRLRVRLSQLHGRSLSSSLSNNGAIPITEFENNVNQNNNNSSSSVGGGGGGGGNENKTKAQLIAECLRDDIELHCPPTTYESFGDALITIWQIVSGDDWDLLTFNAMQDIGNGFAVVYCLIFVIGFVILISVFSSSILAAYLSEAERELELEKDKELLENFENNNNGNVGENESGGDNFLNQNRNDNDNINDQNAFGSDTINDSSAFGASTSVAIFESLEETNLQRSRSAAYKLRADRLLRRSAIADVGRSVESDKLLADLEHQRAEARRYNRVDDDDQWNLVVAPRNGGGSGGGGAAQSNSSNSNSRSNNQNNHKQFHLHAAATAAALVDNVTSTSPTAHLLSPTASSSFDNSNSNQTQQDATRTRNSDAEAEVEVERRSGGEEMMPPASSTTSQYCESISLFFRDVCDHPAFGLFFGCVTGLWMAGQTIYSPFNAPDARVNTLVFTFDAVARSLCVVEFIFKIIAFGGSLSNSKSYWNRSVWNCVEFAITLLGLIGLVLRVSVSKASSRYWVMFIDALFAFRPVTIVRHSATMQIVIRSLFRATSDLIEAVLVIFILMVLYAVAGTQLFAGWFRVCITDQGRGDVLPSVAEVNCSAFDDGAWKNPGSSFDHVFQSLYSVFILTSGELWTESMRRAVDFSGAFGMPRERNGSFYACAYFVIASLMSLVITNVFMAVLVEAYNRCKRSAAAQMSLQTIREHNAWVRSERRLAHVMPTVALQFILEKKNKLSRQLNVLHGVVGVVVSGGVGGGARRSSSSSSSLLSPSTTSLSNTNSPTNRSLTSSSSNQNQNQNHNFSTNHDDSDDEDHVRVADAMATLSRMRASSTASASNYVLLQQDSSTFAASPTESIFTMENSNRDNSNNNRRGETNQSQNQDDAGAGEVADASQLKNNNARNRQQQHQQPQSQEQIQQQFADDDDQIDFEASMRTRADRNQQSGRGDDETQNNNRSEQQRRGGHERGNETQQVVDQQQLHQQGDGEEEAEEEVVVPGISTFKLCIMNLRHHLVSFTDHPKVKLFFDIFACYYCFVPVVCITDPMPAGLATFLDFNEYVLTGIFWLEMFLLLAGRGYRVYIRNAWCRVDGLAAVLAAVFLAVRLNVPQFPRKYRTISWFLRLVRAIKLARGTSTRSIFIRYLYTLRSLAGVLALMCVFFVGFAVVAIRLFGRVHWGPVGGYAPNHQNAFRGLFLSCFYLLRLSLGGSWPNVWWALRQKASGCDLNIGDCGPPTPVPELFFFVFIVTFTYILKNLLVAVTVDVFASSGDFRSLLKVDAQTTVNLWMITQCGKRIQQPSQLRFLFTQRLPLNARVLRFVRSLPPGFPTSPLWLWESLNLNSSSSSSSANSKKSNSSGNNNNNNNVDDLYNQNHTSAAAGGNSQAFFEEAFAPKKSFVNKLFFKKRGLLEPALVLRVIELLYVSHVVRTRKRQHDEEQHRKREQQQRRRRRQNQNDDGDVHENENVNDDDENQQRGSSFASSSSAKTSSFSSNQTPQRPRAMSRRERNLFQLQQQEYQQRGRAGTQLAAAVSKVIHNQRSQQQQQQQNQNHQQTREENLPPSAEAEVGAGAGAGAGGGGDATARRARGESRVTFGQVIVVASDQENETAPAAAAVTVATTAMREDTVEGQEHQREEEEEEEEQNQSQPREEDADSPTPSPPATAQEGEQQSEQEQQQQQPPAVDDHQQSLLERLEETEQSVSSSSGGSSGDERNNSQQNQQQSTEEEETQNQNSASTTTQARETASTSPKLPAAASVSLLDRLEEAEEEVASSSSVPVSPSLRPAASTTLQQHNQQAIPLQHKLDENENDETQAGGGASAGGSGGGDQSFNNNSLASNVSSAATSSQPPQQKNNNNKTENEIITCSFAEVIDILFHMAFMAPFAPEGSDRVFNHFDVEGIRNFATEQDWEDATDFAFELWLAEAIGSVWMSKVLKKRQMKK